MSKKPEHSQIGASSMHRWGNCPGSVALSEGMPSFQSAYAREGSIAHELAAYYLTHNEQFPHEAEMTQEMIDAIHVYTNAVLEDKRAFAYTFKGNLFLVEHGFELQEIDRNAYGTADCVLYNARTHELIVWDFKYGAGISVDVEANDQLLYYALGALLSLPDLKPSKIILKIAQPRCSHPEGQIRTWSFDSSQILDFYSTLESKIRATQKQNAAIVPGEWCRFCPASVKCPALNEKALAFAKEAFAPEKYSPEKLANLLDDADTVEHFISQVREFAYQEAMHGRLPPGYKLVQKRAMRKWAKDDDTIKSYIKDYFEIPAMDLYEKPKLKSPAQVEKLLTPTQKPRLNELVSAESSGYRLAKESEGGEPVQLDAKSVFGIFS